MLKVEFVRYRNVLCVTILEQDEEIRGDGEILSRNGYSLESEYFPALDKKILYLRGTAINNDDLAACCSYDTVEEAKEALQGFKEVIEAYNSELEQQATDMETVVVG